MKTTQKILSSAILGLSLLASLSARADEVLPFMQKPAQSYDDFSSFAADPEYLDSEAAEIFGRFFQSSLLLGTGLFTGDLGKANSAGVLAGLRFVFFFDQVWGLELGGAYARHETLYDASNTHNPNIDFRMRTHLAPFFLGFRYGFDLENLPRGLASMNPFVSVNGEILFRSEKRLSLTEITSGLTDDAQKFTQASTNSTAFGFNVGGGFEFDVYRNKILLGLDMRYHVIFWPDSAITIAEPDPGFESLERGGSYITILGTMTYKY